MSTPNSRYESKAYAGAADLRFERGLAAEIAAEVDGADADLVPFWAEGDPQGDDYWAPDGGIAHLCHLCCPGDLC